MLGYLWKPHFARFSVYLGEVCIDHPSHPEFKQFYSNYSKNSNDKDPYQLINNEIEDEMEPSKLL